MLRARLGQSVMLKPPIHIGFLARDFIKWSGGIWFSGNLLRGLASLPLSQARITVLAPDDSALGPQLRGLAGRLKRALLRPSKARQILFDGPAADRRLALHGIEQLRAIVPQILTFDGSDEDLSRRCEAAGIEVILPVMTPPVHSPIPWVGYLYDCQHKHLPKFFGQREITMRDRAFSRMLQRAPVVFANAEAVLADLRRWFPEGRSALFALPFAPLVAEQELRAALAGGVRADQEMLAGNPYFIVCNQFWVHKDHATAFRAFAAFVSSSSRGHWRLVCTGLTDDYRAPQYITELKVLITELGIADRVVFTGFIDRARQQSLLIGATALLQPTLFEGGPGGGAASDAIALGVPCVLSDIVVNRELSDPLATFFRVGDPASLAARMEAIAQQPPERPEISQLLAKSECSARRLGGTLYAIAEQALAR